MFDVYNTHVDVKEFINDKNLIILFLPKVGKSCEFLPDQLKQLRGLTGCTNQCKIYSDGLSNIKELGFEVVAVTSLKLDKTIEFARSLNINFPIFSDEEFECESLFSLETFNANDGNKFYHRQTLVLKGGRIFAHFKRVQEPENDIKNILKFLESSSN